MNYLCLDVGGTKTQAVLYDLNGLEINRFKTENAHVLQNGLALVVERLKKTLSIVLDLNTVIIIGYAGYGKDKKVRKLIEKACALAFKKYKYHIVSDALMALKASLNGRDGILSIVGTGSIALGIKNNQEYRCGGFGYQLEDEGSGYWIAHEALKVFCKMVDSRVEKTILFNEVIEFFQLENEYDIIAKIHNQDNDIRSLVASFCPSVFKLCAMNDKHCQAIIVQASKHIASLINTLSKNFNKPIYVSYVGSVIEKNEYFLNLVKDNLMEDIIIIKPIHEITYGGFLIAKELFE